MGSKCFDEITAGLLLVVVTITSRAVGSTGSKRALEQNSSEEKQEQALGPSATCGCKHTARCWIRKAAGSSVPGSVLGMNAGANCEGCRGNCSRQRLNIPSHIWLPVPRVPVLNGQAQQTPAAPLITASSSLPSELLILVAQPEVSSRENTCCST